MKANIKQCMRLPLRRCSELTERSAQISVMPMEHKDCTPTSTDAVDGAAALSVCEALILTLVRSGVVDAKLIDEMLSDVVSAHRIASETASVPGKHRSVIKIVENLRQQTWAAIPKRPPPSLR